MIIATRLFFQKEDFISWVFYFCHWYMLLLLKKNPNLTLPFPLLHKKNSLFYLTTLRLNMNFFLK